MEGFWAAGHWALCQLPPLHTSLCLCSSLSSWFLWPLCLRRPSGRCQMVEVESLLGLLQLFFFVFPIIHFLKYSVPYPNGSCLNIVFILCNVSQLCFHTLIFFQYSVNSSSNDQLNIIQGQRNGRLVFPQVYSLIRHRETLHYFTYMWKWKRSNSYQIMLPEARNGDVSRYKETLVNRH